MMPMLKAYVASPYGFSEAGRYFMQASFMPRIQETGLDILDPWSAIKNRSSNEILNASKTMTQGQAMEIGVENMKMIKKADLVIAVLDGSDVDSGVAAEIGYALGLGKKIIGYRGDFRQTGDSAGVTINLQVQTFVEESGGKIYSSFDDLLNAISGMIGFA